MTDQLMIQPILLVKIILWIAAVAAATILLRRRLVTSRLRTAWLAGGTVLFGFVFGALVRGGVNPNPVMTIRAFLKALILEGRVAPLVAGMLGAFLIMSVFSNKSLCGWGCQLGLLQDLLHRVKLPKWKPKPWLSTTIRAGTFAALLIGLAVGTLDIIGVIDPFRILSFRFTLWIGIFSGIILAGSLFVYRPWCRFICPFGLVSWITEQVSLFRPRINREECKGCRLCVTACPSGAMEDIFTGKRLHVDCFACGACIEACSSDNALGWWSPSQARRKEITITGKGD